MKRLIFIALLISLVLPATVLAQDVTPAQLMQQANQAASNAAGYQSTANGLRATANAYDQQASAEYQRSQELKQQAIQLQANQDAIKVAASAQEAADRARLLYLQSAAATARANVLDFQAIGEWTQAFSLMGRAVNMSLSDTARQQLNNAQMKGVVSEQRNTITVMNSQIDSKDRLILGAGLLALALVATIVWLVVRSNQRTVAQLTLAFATASKRDDTAIVRDNSVKTYRVLSEVADGTDA